MHGTRILQDEKLISQKSNQSQSSSSSDMMKKDLDTIPFEKLTEEQQIELAIKKSLSEADTTNNNKIGNDLCDSEDELDEWSDDEELSQKGYEKFLGENSGTHKYSKLHNQI